MAESVAVWRHLVAARIRADWQYRTSFLLFLVSQAAVAVFDLAVIAALFSQVDTLAGWSGVEVALLFGLATLSFGIADTLVSPVEMVSRHLRAGTFDHFLLRPTAALVHLVGVEFALRRIGRTLQPVVVLVVALVAAPIEWTPERVLLVPVALAAGTVIFASIWVATSAISFWTVDSQEFANAFTYGGGLAAQFPIDVFAGWLRRFATFVVPIAFVAYLPAARLLGKDRPLGLPAVSAWAAPLIAALTSVAAGLIWRTAIRRHRSTGS